MDCTGGTGEAAGKLTCRTGADRQKGPRLSRGSRPGHHSGKVSSRSRSAAESNGAAPLCTAITGPHDRGRTARKARSPRRTSGCRLQLRRVRGGAPGRRTRSSRHRTWPGPSRPRTDACRSCRCPGGPHRISSRRGRLLYPTTSVYRLFVGCIQSHYRLW